MDNFVQLVHDTKYSYEMLRQFLYVLVNRADIIGTYLVYKIKIKITKIKFKDMVIYWITKHCGFDARECKMSRR